MAQEDVPGLSGLGGEAEIEIADLVLGMGEEEGRRQEQGLGARVARFTREGYGILEGRAAHAGHERDAAAFGRKVNQARALLAVKRGVLAGRVEEGDTGDTAAAKEVDQFKRGAEIDFSLLAARRDGRGINASEWGHRSSWHCGLTLS